ncbi:MAG: hypothetical protein U9R47_05650 [Actinomycetota bacterium]|nr:hypothetical protein [Actinomycetota bacterium]
MGRQNTNGGLRCSTCGQDTVIEIELKLPDGSEVVFCSCHRCEAKWWDRDGEQLDLDALVDVARREA